MDREAEISQAGFIKKNLTEIIWLILYESYLMNQKNETKKANDWILSPGFKFVT